MKTSAMYRFMRLWIPACCWLLAAVNLYAQEFKVYDSLPQLESRIRQAGDTTLVINFWATWCKPCVEELPSFETLRERYASDKVQVILVSLDFKSQIEKKFIPFLKSQNLNSEVILFADQDTNTWIPAIDEEWDGAIPATLVFQRDKRGFNLGKFEDYTSLESFIIPFMSAIQPVSSDRVCAGTGK